MQTDALKLAEQAANTGQAELLSWGMIEIQVTDLGRAVEFWTSAIGLQVIEQDANKAILGTESKSLFTLHAGAEIRVSPPYTGLYHVAIGAPDQKEFSRILARLISLDIPLAPTDHLMSKAIYITDPDGLEIEIALETPERFGRFGDMSQGLVLYDVDGQPHNGRAPMDIKAELAHAEGAELAAPLSTDAFLAHVHFKVADLEAAASWYENLGFARNLFLPHFGFADMGTGAAYTHRLAMNTWAGANVPAAPKNMAGLVSYELHLHDESLLEKAKGVLTSSDTGLSGTDPTGVIINLV